MDYFDKAETWDRATLETVQLARLKTTIQQASRAPFYAKRLAEAGVSADNLRSLEDIRRIPFTSKDDLRSQYPYGLATVPHSEFVRMHCSSGTTGTPVAVCYTQSDINSWADLMARSMFAAGIRRVEFVTGHAAEKYAQDIEDKLHDISKILKTNTNDLEARINLLLEDKKRLETEILNLKKQFVSHKTADNQDKIETVNGIKFVAKQIDNVQAKELKAFVDEIKEQIKSGVIALFSCNEGKVSAVIGVTDDLTGKYSAVGLIKTVAPFIGANGGGGRPDMAQTGGAETSRINEAIEALRKSI